MLWSAGRVCVCRCVHTYEHVEYSNPHPRKMCEFLATVLNLLKYVGAQLPFEYTCVCHSSLILLVLFDFVGIVH